MASADDVFAASDIDAVLVATVTNTHADYIEKAVAAGKPVLCEKPIDLSLERVNRCAEAVLSKGIPIQIGFNRRFDPGHRAAWKAARSGEIGDLHQVIITSRDPGMPPRAYYETAGGLFRDMTIHDFDLARFMLGEEPEEVFAVGGRLIDPGMMQELGDYDSCMVVMRTKVASSATSTIRARPPMATTSASNCSARPAWSSATIGASMNCATFPRPRPKLRTPISTSSSNATVKPSTPRSTPSSPVSSGARHPRSALKTAAGRSSLPKRR